VTESAHTPSSLSPDLDAAEDEISLLDLLQVIVENLRLLVLGPLAVGLAVLGISFTITPTFTAKTQFLPPQQQQSAAASMLASLGSLGGLAGAVGGIKNPSDQFLAYMKSVTLQDRLVERFKLQERYETKTKEDTRKTLTANMRAAAGKDGLISVEVDDKSPQFAADLANAHVEELRNLLAKLAVTEAQQRRMFFEKQLSQTKEKLTEADLALKATGMSASVLKASPASAVAVVAALKAQVTVQEVKLGAMRGYLAETAPDFKQALTELANLRSQLAKQEQGEPQAKADKVKSDPTKSSTDKGDGDYTSKYREFKYQETLFELFAKQFEIAKVDESREGAVIQVLDRAEPPERKAKPAKAMIAVIATMASGFALLLWVFVRQALRGAAQNPESAAKFAHLKSTLYKALGRA
jgi:uncharacterized protein involved in exopolysaccharide biosynthesis